MAVFMEINYNMLTPNMVTMCVCVCVWGGGGGGGRFKNLRALEISMLYKNHIFQCMGMIFCVELQRVPLKFYTKYLTHTLKDVDFIHR